MAPLLQGSPYVTMLYDGSLTPMLSAQMVGSATAVDGKKVACAKGMARAWHPSPIPHPHPTPVIMTRWPVARACAP